MELRKAPRMETALGFRVFLHLGTCPNMGQILNHNGTAKGSVLHDTFGEDMIMVFALPKQFTTQLFEVSLCRFGAFGLQFPFDAKDPSLLLFPATFTQEVFVRGHCRAIESQVNTNHFMRGSNNRVRDAYHNMQGISTFAETQVSRTDLATDVPGRVIRYREGEFNPPSDRGKATGHCVPFHPVRTSIITNWTDPSVRGAGFAFLLATIQGTLDSFRGFDTSGTHQLCRKIRILGAQGVIRSLMQFHPIGTRGGKPLMCHSIKALGMLLQRSLQDLGLLAIRLDMQDNRSVHAKSISYRASFVY
jgi:hypothetical protein